MAFVERRCDGIHVAIFEPVTIKLNLDFKRLPRVAHVGGNGDARFALEVLVGKPALSLDFKPVHFSDEIRQCARFERAEHGCDEITFEISNKPTERADNAWSTRHKHATNAQFLRNEHAQHRAAATERHEGEFGWIDTVTRDELIELNEHVGH